MDISLEDRTADEKASSSHSHYWQGRLTANAAPPLGTDVCGRGPYHMLRVHVRYNSWMVGIHLKWEGPRNSISLMRRLCNDSGRSTNNISGQLVKADERGR